MNYDHILAKVYDSPWMITQSGMDLVLSIIDRKMLGEQISEEEMAIILKGKKEQQQIELPEKPSVAVLPIQGPIFPKANLMTALSGATSVSKLKSDFAQLMDSDNVTSIVLNIDSPGGHADQIKEMADVIYAAREKNVKPIYAVANSMACSAAYYLASQADKFYTTPSGEIGSIGVVAVHTDTTSADEKAGVKRTVLHVGEHKAEGNPHEPLSEDAKAHKLANMQEVYDQFVEDVARGRNTSTETVLENYGKGRYYKSKTALKRGMVDGIETLDSVVGRLTEQASKSTISNHHMSGSTRTEGVVMPELTEAALAALGLTQDATSEDIENAIETLRAKPGPIEAKLENFVTPEFEKQYPEIAKKMKEDSERLAKLAQSDRENTAKLFAKDYEQFSDKEHGFSALSLGMVESLHLKIADGVVTHDDLKELLDNVASGDGIVDYSEKGSTRGEEADEVGSGYEAASKLVSLAHERMVEKGESYGDAMSALMEEHPELRDAYRSSLPKREGGEN